jgi:gliding motility-associated-like protein
VFLCCVIKGFILYCLILCSLASQAQNLVQNGGFERSMKPIKSKFAGSIEQASPWFAAGKGSPDLIKDNDVPYGRQKAFEGNQFAGIVLYDADNSEFREYLEVRLTRPLLPQEQVCLRLKISAAKGSRYFVDGLGFSLTKDSIRTNNWKVIAREPELKTKQFNPLSDTSALWQSLEFTYISKGGEEFLTIGNFKNDAATALLPNNKPSFYRIAYIYLDEIYLGSCSTNEDKVKPEILPVVGPNNNQEELPASMLHVPNVVTPNGDGFNDIFYVVGLPKYSNLKILTKKGLEIYSTTNYKNDWDGHDVPSGNYRYELSLPDGNVISGPLDVVRKKN